MREISLYLMRKFLLKNTDNEEFPAFEMSGPVQTLI